VIPVDLLGVRVVPPSNAPFVVLRELREPGRSMMIFIGEPEAMSINMALQGETTPRPMTHDLLLSVIEELGAEIVRVVVTHLDDTTFFAELHLDLDDEVLEISARPSDCFALAARTAAPIYVAEAVLDDVGVCAEEQPSGEVPDTPPEEVVEEFHKFIESVSPEDFGPAS